MLYVDNILVICNDKNGAEALRRFFPIKFAMKELGEVKMILGIRIVRDRNNGALYLSQRNYIDKLL